MDIYLQALLIAAAGVVAGAVNVAAGGGSLLTVPLLIFLGLPGPVANGTNRVGLIAQNLSAIRTFYRGGVLDLRQAGPLALAALPGVAVGAVIGARIDDLLFRQILGVTLLVVLLFLARKPRAETDQEAERPWPRVWTLMSFLGIGFYSGFIQIGVGFLVLFALVGFERLGLVRANAIKVTVILIFQLLAVAIYASAGAVHWIAGLTLAVGMSLGAWIGARLSLSRGERFLRPFMVICVLVFAIKLIAFP